MMYASKLRASWLLSALFFLPYNAGGQSEGAFVPPPRGAVHWMYTRPNFYDTKLTGAQKVLLAPLPEDQSAHAEFLKQENTGICRLHPKGRYEPGLQISVKEAETDMILPILGGGAYFSFTERTNKFGPWSDLCLKDKQLTGSGSGGSVGILTDLGDTPLSSVTPTTPGLAYLTNLNPPKKQSELAALLEKSSEGIEANGFTYRSHAPATLNTTFVLRSILYKRNGYLVRPDEPYHRLKSSLLGYNGSDVLVALRVIRCHEDGSVTILWKRLRKFGAPKFTGRPGY